MKNLLLSTALLLMLLVACQTDKSIGPPDLLYRRWHLAQTRSLTSNDWQTRDTDAYYTVEYHADGSLIYERNNAQIEASCCAPTIFTRQGLTLIYTSWNICPTAFCALIKQVTIAQLTESLLELNDGYTISQYEVAK